MKQPIILRRVMPFLVLTAILMSLAVPATALLPGDADEAASVAAFAKNSTIDNVISFSRDDFVVETEGKTELDSILINSLPDVNAGVLMLGSASLVPGDQISMNAISGLKFYPLTAPTVASTCFTFTPVFSNGLAGDQVSVSLYLLSAKNNPPIAQDLEISTYKNVAVTGFFSATDPEGDLLFYRIVKKPARGSVSIAEEGSNMFIYTPYENKTGKDSFTYVAVDSVGNASEPATVTVRIDRANTKVTYADMSGSPAYKSALQLAESSVFVGECMGDSYFFNPDSPVTRSEFVAMAMNVAGMDALEGIPRPGFADDVLIPTWAKPYVASALKAGVIQGSVSETGQIVFNADNTITRAEATVLLNRILDLSDVTTDVWYADSAATPAWAYQAAINLETVGIIRTDSSGALSLNSSLTRGDAAQMLAAAMDVLEAREATSWFHWSLG